LWLKRTLYGIKHDSTPYLEKRKKIIVQRRRGFSMLLFFLPLPETRKMETYKVES